MAYSLLALLLYATFKTHAEQIVLQETKDFKCQSGTVTYKIADIDVFVLYDCTTASNVNIIGKKSGYGSVRITKIAWKTIQNLEIRHVGNVSIEGGADENFRHSIIVSSCDKLESNATHWGETTIFDSIKTLSVTKVTGKSQTNILVIRKCDMQVTPIIEGKFMSIEMTDSNIGTINTLQTSGNNQSVIKISGNTIREINSNSIVLGGGKTHFSLKNNDISAVRDKGLTFLNHVTEITHNKFYTLSPSWLRLQTNSTTIIASNTFYQVLSDITFEGSTSECVFESNNLYHPGNVSLESTYDKCLIHDVRLEVSCDCGMKFSHKDETKCIVHGLESLLCYSDKYTLIEEYQRSSCKEHKYATWSECGSKTNGLIIGLSFVALLVILNIIGCYFCKRYCCHGAQWRRRHESVRNNYELTGNNVVTQKEREPSVEFSLDGLVDGQSTIKVSKRKPNFLNKLSCVPVKPDETNVVFPTQHPPDSEDYDNTYDYYSNDKDFNDDQASGANGISVPKHRGPIIKKIDMKATENPSKVPTDDQESRQSSDYYSNDQDFKDAQTSGQNKVPWLVKPIIAPKNPGPPKKNYKNEKHRY